LLDPIYKLLGLNKESSLAQYLIKGSSASFFIQILFIGISFISTVIAANIAGSAEYGRYTAIMAWLNIMVVFALAGNQVLAIREVAKYQSTGQSDVVQTLWQHTFWRVILCSLLTAIVAWFLLNSIGVINSENVLLFKMALIALPMWAVATLVTSFLRGSKHIVLSQVPDKIVRPIGFFLLISIAWLFFNKINAEHIFQIQLVLLVFLLITAFYLLNKKESWVFKTNGDNSYVKGWSAMGYVFLFQGVIQIANGKIDILTLDYYRTDSEVGIYSIALKIADLLIIILFIVNIVIAPEIAGLFNNGRMEKLQLLLKRSIQITFAISIPIALFLIIGGKWILSYFGEDFILGYPILVLVVLVQLINVGVGSVGCVLNMTGHENEASYGLFISLAVNLVLNFFLVPTMGMIGAAIASGASIVVWNIIMWISVKRKLGINTSVINFK